jgi:broad specificity phosphatase PhoE
MERGVPFVLHAAFQENSDKPCDVGTNTAIMAKEYPQFDWEAVDPAYPAKTGLYEFSKEGITRRGIEARRWLKNRPEKVIAVVSHAGFLRVGVSNRQYNNADYRIFDFAEGTEDDANGGRLNEWKETEDRGGGLGTSEKGVFGFETQYFPPKRTGADHEENDTPSENAKNVKG